MSALDPAPRVSFLLAVHNDARFLPATLRSMLDQSFHDFEIVAIDDGSTDRTTEILQATGDARVRYYRNTSNMGLIQSLNRGIALCRGELIARIDGDDICEPQRLEAQVRYLDDRPRLAGCATWTTEIDENGRVIGSVEPLDDPDYIRWSMCHVLRLYHPSMTLRRCVYEQAGGYDADFPSTEDYELWTRLVASGQRLGVVPQRLIRYRRRPGSISSLNAQRQREDGQRIATRYISQILDRPCDAETIGVMRSLLAWEEAQPQSLEAARLQKALVIMGELRSRILNDACHTARAAADDEVAQHLLRQGRFMLRSAPHISSRLAMHVARLPNHRFTALKLLAVAVRCRMGRFRAPRTHQ